VKKALFCNVLLWLGSVPNSIHSEQETVQKLSKKMGSGVLKATDPRCSCHQDVVDNKQATECWRCLL